MPRNQVSIDYLLKDIVFRYLFNKFPPATFRANVTLTISTQRDSVEDNNHLSFSPLIRLQMKGCTITAKSSIIGKLLDTLQYVLLYYIYNILVFP